MALIDSKISRTSSSPAGTPASSAKKPAISGPLSKTPVGTAGGFEKGQILKGEIIDLRDRDVKIQLSDQRIITAHLDSSTALSIGSRATFQVTETSLASMSLKLLSEEAQITGEQMIDKALEEAGLPHTERNIATVRALLANQMSINKTSIQTILKQASTFQNASVETLVLMNKYSLPITQVSTSQFEAYRNYEHRILQQLDSLSELFFSAKDGCQTNFPLANHLLQLLSSEENTAGLTSPFQTAEQGGQEKTSELSSSKVLPSLFAAPTAEHLETPVGTLLNQDSLLHLADLLDTPELSDTNRVRLLTGEASLAETAQMILDTATRENETLRSNTVPEIIASLPDSLSNADVYTVVNQYETLLKETNAPGAFLSSKELETLSNEWKEAGLPDQKLTLLRTGELSGKEMLAVLREQFSANSSETVKKLFSSEALQKVVRELLTSHWTLTPKELTKPHALERYYDRLEQELTELMKFSSQTEGQNADSQSRNSYQSTAQNVLDNIDFMKTLNQIFTYIQLPMHLSSQNAHSELYVYSRKNQRSEDPHKIHVLLHLDLEQLGLMDIHLNLNGTMLKAQFYVEDPTSAPILSGHMDILSNSLSQKGYQFISEVLKREKPVDIVRDFIAPEEPDAGMKRYTFDIRA